MRWRGIPFLLLFVPPGTALIGATCGALAAKKRWRAVTPVALPLGGGILPGFLDSMVWLEGGLLGGWVDGGILGGLVSRPAGLPLGRSAWRLGLGGLLGATGWMLCRAYASALMGLWSDP